MQYELYYGAFKSVKKEQTFAILKDFFKCFKVIPFNKVAAEKAGEIRADLEQKGTPIGPYDILIGASAIASSSTLVTHNIKEFSRISGLLIEDWEG